jgi:hypothetical protein
MDLALLFAVFGIFILLRLKVGHEMYIRWGGLLLTVIVVFGLLALRSKESHRTRSFWILIAIFVALNLVVFGLILASVSEWKLPWFGIMLIEVPIFIMLRDRLQSQ